MHMSNLACPPRERNRTSTWYIHGSVTTPQILSMRAPNPLKLANGTRHRILAPLEALFFKQWRVGQVVKRRLARCLDDSGR